MIVITGATGQLGSKVVKHLLTLVPPSTIRVAVRDPSKVSHLSSQGVEVGEGDYSSPDFIHSLKDCDKLLLVSAPLLGKACIDAHRNAINAAKQASVKTIYYTSHVGASHDSAFEPGRNHAETADMLEGSGLRYVILRNGFYPDTLIRLATAAKKTGEIAAPEDGQVSWTTRDDLAEATAILLAKPDQPTESHHVFLTNAESIDLKGAAAIVSKQLDKPIQRKVISDNEMIQGMMASGIPEMYAKLLLTFYDPARKGDFGKVDRSLEELIGRKPKSMQEILREALA